MYEGWMAWVWTPRSHSPSPHPHRDHQTRGDRGDTTPPDVCRKCAGRVPDSRTQVVGLNGFLQEHGTGSASAGPGTARTVRHTGHVTSQPETLTCGSRDVTHSRSPDTKPTRHRHDTDTTPSASRYLYCSDYIRCRLHHASLASLTALAYILSFDNEITKWQKKCLNYVSHRTNIFCCDFVLIKHLSSLD